MGANLEGGKRAECHKRNFVQADLLSLKCNLRSYVCTSLATSSVQHQGLNCWSHIFNCGMRAPSKRPTFSWYHVSNPLEKWIECHYKIGLQPAYARAYATMQTNFLIYGNDRIEPNYFSTCKFFCVWEFSPRVWKIQAAHKWGTQSNFTSPNPRRGEAMQGRLRIMVWHDM